jgi:hypothetical protein
VASLRLGAGHDRGRKERGNRLLETREEIEQGFVEAGWQLDGGFSGRLIVGENENLSILAHKWVWGSDNPVFELGDGERSLTIGFGKYRRPSRRQSCSKSMAGHPKRSGATPTNRMSRVGNLREVAFGARLRHHAF